jgi:TRAP-type uncharacterized transport system substrate-binding protein
MEPNPKPDDSRQPEGAPQPLALKVTTISWSDLAHTLVPILLLSAAAIWLTLHFVQPAPPHTLVMSAGPPGSSFELAAERLRTLLARNGITLKILPSAGSAQNLERLNRPHSRVDIALVQSGTRVVGGVGAAPTHDQDDDAQGLVSLGSMFYQPVTIFYRGPRVQRLSQLRGERIAIGKRGSGTRTLALALLKANGIVPGGPTQLVDLDGAAARDALLAGRVNAIFLTGDSTPPAVIIKMVHTAGIRLFNFTQAAAYIRRFPYLHELDIPAGAFDLGANLPHERLVLLGPAVELLAHADLPAALCDLLIQAAQRVYGQATVLHAAHEFPNTETYSFPLDAEAANFYKTGDKSFTYRYLPFWVASLVNRILVVLVPVIVVLVPGLRFLPQLYGWRVNSRIHRRYGELMALERESIGPLSRERRAALLDRLHQIERGVILRKMPGSHAQQIYLLREHIEFVRNNLSRAVSD